MSQDDLITTTCRISKPAQRALAAAGLTTYRQLSAWSERALADLHGIGPRALADLKQALADRGVTLQRGTSSPS